ncbi:hypothetical protein [Streptomyces sp. NPDC048002]|uniref:hypothetical protein n=1 Tax=Streptomyces sp. NPDC048002 TaxID=3154344 RepID=UPI0033FA9A44
MAPFRNLHLAAGFIVVMYALLGALLGGVVAAAFSAGGPVAGVAACAGGLLGAAVGLWRIHQTPQNERADEGTF